MELCHYLQFLSCCDIAKESNHISCEHLALLLVWETVRENPVLVSQDDLLNLWTLNVNYS